MEAIANEDAKLAAQMQLEDEEVRLGTGCSHISVL